MLGCRSQGEAPHAAADAGATASAQASGSAPLAASASADRAPAADGTRISARGCELDVSLRAVKAVIVAGEPTHVEYVVASQCDEPLHVIEGGGLRTSWVGTTAPARRRRTGRDAGRGPARRPGLRRCHRGRADVARQAPREAAAAAALGPARQARRLPDHRRGGARHASPDPRAEARGPGSRRGPAPVEVLPHPRELSPVIEALATQAAAGSGTSASRRWHRSRRSTTRMLARLTDMEDEAESRRLVAVRCSGLRHRRLAGVAGGASRCTEAGDAARGGARNRANENARAAQLLWSLSTDKLESVRIEVARGVHRKDPAGTKAKLEELSRDPSPAVRAEVARLARQAPASP